MIGSMQDKPIIGSMQVLNPSRHLGSALCCYQLGSVWPK